MMPKILHWIKFPFAILSLIVAISNQFWNDWLQAMGYEQYAKNINEESRSIIDTKKLNAECQGTSENCSEI